MLFICYPNIFSNKAAIHAGSLNPRLLTVKERKIKKIIFHPLYDNVSQYYDLSLLVLDEVSTQLALDASTNNKNLFIAS